MRHASVSAPKSERIRLYVITVTGSANMPLASRIQDSWSHFVGPHDRYITLCDVGCARNTTNPGPISELNSTLVESIHRNQWLENDNGGGSWGYRLAQLKFYFGLVNQVRELRAAGGLMPEWFLIKDDDTYMHADRLMQLVEGVDFDREKVSVVGGHAGRRIENRYPKEVPVEEGPPSDCIWPDGGAGWLISRVQAETLALEYGDRILDLMVSKIEQAPFGFYYDRWIPEIARWGGGQLYHSPSLHNFPEWYDDKLCPTSNSSMASIHIKQIVARHGLEKGLHQIEECFQQPFAPLEVLKDRIASSNDTGASVVECGLPQNMNR